MEHFLLGSPRCMNFLSPSAVTVECAWKSPSQEKIRWLSSPTISLDLSKVLKLRVYFVMIPEIWYIAKRELERLQFSTSSSFVKIWNAWSCEFKAYFWIFSGFITLSFWSRNYWSWFNYHLMVSFGEKAKIKKEGNLN